MANVHMRDVRKSFGATEVLRGISIDIEDGEFTALVGPSGCGKSTLLRMVAGLERITGGEIAIADEVVNDMPPKDRDIAMVFQSYALYPHMTVRDNMGFSLEMKRSPKDLVSDRVAGATEILGLQGLLDRFPRQLSGGQRQRVAMGRAIVRDPKVFLFDEPLSNLDAKLRVQMRTEIKALHHRLKTTTIFVTHDQVEAMTMADKIVVMNGGRVEQIGTPLELYDRPCNLFVAGFIGSPAMNFMDGTIIEGGIAFHGADTAKLEIVGTPAENGRAVVYGIRPEHWTIAEAGIPGEVLVVEFTGSETLVFVKLAGQNVVVAQRERIKLQPGEKVFLKPDHAQAHIFDAQSGLRL